MGTIEEGSTESNEMTVARQPEEEQLWRELWNLEDETFRIQGTNWIENEKAGIEMSELLPGIPNEVTFATIVTKLSWRDVHLLKGVSWSWYIAIRDRLVYDTRVHFHVTEAFLFQEYFNDSIVLRCLRDNSYLELPKFPHLPHCDERRPLGKRFVAADGKVYVIGGVFYDPSDKVHMLDLAAGHRSWTQVASMHIARSNCICGVMGGKIYVFGGISDGLSFSTYVHESEVYDPKENTWSFIKPMCTLMWCGESEKLGEELFVYGTDITRKDVVEVYHPIKDEWRKVESFAKPSENGVLFISRGRVYSMDNLCIWVYSFEGNSWTQVCSHSFTAIQSNYPFEFYPYFVKVADDSLLALGELHTLVASRATHAFVTLRSIWFPSEKGELEWREERAWGSWDMCGLFPIHL